jgi:cystathionine gamma-synthase
MAIATHVGHDGKLAMPFLNPNMLAFARNHITSEHREEHRCSQSVQQTACVDLGGERLYLVMFDKKHSKAFVGVWQNAGLGLSIRHGERLLKHIGDTKVVDAVLTTLPEPTWTAESTAHPALRKRISELLHRAPIDPEKVTCTPTDIYLYPTGMAPIWYLTKWLYEYRPGSAAMIGIPFHNTYHLLLDEAPEGLNTFGMNDQGMIQFEAWLDNETAAGRKVTWVLTEFAANPTLDTPDIVRLKHLVSLFRNDQISTPEIGQLMRISY